MKWKKSTDWLSPTSSSLSNSECHSRIFSKFIFPKRAKINFKICRHMFNDPICEFCATCRFAFNTTHSPNMLAPVRGKPHLKSAHLVVGFLAAWHDKRRSIRKPREALSAFHLKRIRGLRAPFRTLRWSGRTAQVRVICGRNFGTANKLGFWWTGRAVAIMGGSEIFWGSLIYPWTRLGA